MNEFTRMIREALIGEESPDEAFDRTEVREALARLDKRDTLVRFMGWFTVTFWAAITAFGVWQFFHAPENDTRALIGWAVLVLASFGGIAFGKMFIFLMQAHLGLQRDMKRIELRLVDTAPDRS